MKPLTKMTLLCAVALPMAAGTVLAQQKTSATIGMQLEPPNLDPTGGAAAAIDEVVYANLFEGLTRFRADGSIAPALATDWQISEDGLTYTFDLADDVTFHDGTAFTADDVVFSLERAMADDSTNAQKALFADIGAVEAIDDDTVEVTLSQPNGAFLFNLAWGDAVVVAEETAADNATSPVGTGPFRFGEWRQGDSVTLERYADYWGEAPALESVTFRFISDPTAAYAAMMAGDIDAFPNFPAPENLQQFEADPRFAIIVGSTEGETILGLNNAREPFSDIRVREAIAHAIDRQAIIDGAMFGYGTPIGTHFAPHNPAYVDLTDLSSYDPERARALLREAGIEDGLQVTLKLPPPSYARRGGEILASQLREVGIEPQIINVEWAQWLEEVFNGGDFDMTIVSHTEPMDINIYAREDYYFAYGKPEFQALMDELAATTAEDARDALLKDAQRMIAEDYVNGFLFQLARTGVRNADLEGLWENAPTQANDMTSVHWAE